MNKERFVWQKYLLAAAGGAVVGGLVVAVASKAIPRIMPELMAGMMRRMMVEMAEGGCHPREM